jgi:hypothetical protein
MMVQRGPRGWGVGGGNRRVNTKGKREESVVSYRYLSNKELENILKHIVVG